MAVQQSKATTFQLKIFQIAEIIIKRVLLIISFVDSKAETYFPYTEILKSHNIRKCKSAIINLRDF